MVNREKRDGAKRLLEDFRSRKITNFDLDNSFPSDKADPALAGIYERLWHYWDDLRTHLYEKGGNPSVDILFQRSIAFLGSDLEYEWPPWGRARGSLLLAFLRLLGSRKKAEEIGEARLAPFGGSETILRIWPFKTEEELQRYIGRN